jgi:hypothetical protein
MDGHPRLVRPRQRAKDHQARDETPVLIGMIEQAEPQAEDSEQEQRHRVDRQE